MRFSTVLTSEQAGILYDLVKANRSAVIERWAFGVCDGLLQSLAQIDRGGGACVRGSLYGWPSAPGCGSDLIEAAIIPTFTYIAWPGVKTIPGPFWELAAMLPELSVEHLGETLVWRPVSVYRAMSPLAVIPLVAAVLPADNPLAQSPRVTP